MPKWESYLDVRLVWIGELRLDDAHGRRLHASEIFVLVAHAL